jgi:purine-cytosine permease-like protein
MMSTDDAPNDEAEEAFAPPRLRRSTYTPPPQYRDVVAPPDPEPADDPGQATDAATAPVAAPDAAPTGAAATGAAATGAVATGAAPADAAPTAAADAVFAPPAAPVSEPSRERAAPAAPARLQHYSDAPPAPQHENPAPYKPWVPEPPSESTALWDALVATTPRPVFEPLEEAPTQAPTADVPPTAEAPATADASSIAEAPPAADASSTAETPAAAEAPADVPPTADPAALAVQPPPAGRPWVPRRRSLPDDELLSAVGAAGSRPGGTLSAIDALEHEIRLREEEVQEYREWEQSMLAVGTPEALAAVEQVRPVFSEITIPEELTTSQIPVQWAPEYPAQSSAPTPPPAGLSMFAPPPLVDPSATPPLGSPRAISVDTGGIARTVAPAPERPGDSGRTEPGRAEPWLPASPVTGPAPAANPEPRSTALVGFEPAPVENDSPAAVPGAERAPVFSLELSGLLPTPVDYRVGRASRLFWLWFAANSSLVSVAFGAVVFSLGMSLRQAIVSTLAGVALSFIPLGLGTLAGKRSGQPTVVVSRAAFGTAGNIVPAVIALVSRVFWGAVLLWLFAASIAAVVADGGSTSGLVIVFIVVGVMLAVMVAYLGYALLARFQLVASILSALLIVGFVAITAGRVDVAAALTQADGPWVLVTTGAILVFSFVGLVWANSSSDLARYQRPESSSGANMLWATFGTAVPTFLLIAYGALLAASDPDLASGLSSRPIETLESLVPGWYVVPLIATIGVSLLSAVVVTVYSGAFALQGVGLRLERQWATLVVGVLLAILAGLFSALSADLTTVFRDLATTLAVPVAAWVGIFAADAMIRNRPLHTASLLVPGGVYPSVNWVNLPALVGITVFGWGLTSATSGGLDWQGYLFALGGVPSGSDLAASDLGVVVALVLGLLTPIVAGVPEIRRQEDAAAALL